MENTTNFVTLATAATKNVAITFYWYDYALFGLMLASSVLIGIYFGFFDKKEASADEYLFGGRTMKAIPIALSLVGSHISGILVLAIPAEIYMFGATYTLMAVASGIGCMICVHFYVPVYHNLGLSSIYKYLELRFDRSLRIMSSLLYLVKVFCYLPVVIYVPALALSQVTGWNVKVITPLLCCVCIFYTTIGGLKTVVWTDTLQLVVMYIALIAVMILGLITVGGFGVVYDRAMAGDRLQMSFDLDPTKRDTFWTVFVGYIFSGTSLLAVNQGHVQKFISLPNMRSVKLSALFFSFSFLFAKIIVVLIGLIMYARYYDCDPVNSKTIHKHDELVPYFVMDVANTIPGLSGLFIAGIFCASLSTLSAYLNSLSGIVYEDFISRYMPEKMREQTVSNILKLLVVIIGVFCTSLVYIVEHLGGVLPLVISMTSMATGPLMGIFTLGMFFPKANTKGALFGSMLAFALVLSLVMGTQYYKFAGILKEVPKPLSVEGCEVFVNTTLTSIPRPGINSVHWIFKISHYYYCMIGTTLTLLFGVVISFLTADPTAPPADPSLLSPVLVMYLRNKGNVYDSVKLTEYGAKDLYFEIKK